MLLNRWRDSCMRFWKGQRSNRESITNCRDVFPVLCKYAASGPTHHFVVLYEHHVVRTESAAEDDAGHALEAVDPLLSLWPLTSHIEHPVHNRTSERSLQRLGSGMFPGAFTWSAALCRRTVLQWYRLFWLETVARPAQWGCSPTGRFCPFHWGSWNTTVELNLQSFFPKRLKDSVFSRDSLASGVVQLVLSSSLVGGLHTRVLPQLLDDIGQLRGHRSFFDGVWQVLQLLCVFLWSQTQNNKHQHVSGHQLWAWAYSVCRRRHLSTGRAEVDAKHLHASDDSQSRLQDVAVDDRSKLHLLLSCVTTLMENSVTKMKRKGL